MGIYEGDGADRASFNFALLNLREHSEQKRWYKSVGDKTNVENYFFIPKIYSKTCPQK